MKILKNTIIISSITLISRCFGCVRDIVIASAIGAGPLNDALIAAWRFANLFRSLFAEGALTASFVPIFSSTMAKNDKESAMRFASSIFSILLIILILFSAIIIFFMPEVMSVFTPGFAENEEIFNIAVILAKITFPYLLFISLAALYGCVLSSIGKFAPFSSTAIIFNIVIIFFVLYFEGFANKALAVAYGILCAGAVELLWMILWAYKYNMSVIPRIPHISPEIRLMFRRIGAGIIGSGVYHISIWIDMIIVSFVAGGMSYLYYADRIMQLPLAIIATAASTSLLPALSKSIANKEHSNSDTLNDTSLKFTMYFLIPISFTSIYFSHEIVEILFEHGAFNSDSTTKTSSAFAALSLGLPAFAMVKLFSSIFHARGDISTPVKIAIWMLILNATISLSLLHLMQHVGVALGSTISSWLNAGILLTIMHRNRYYKLTNSILFTFSVYIACSILSLCLMGFMHQRLWDNKVLDFAFVILLGMSTYIGTTYSVINIYKRFESK